MGMKRPVLLLLCCLSVCRCSGQQPPKPEPRSEAPYHWIELVQEGPFRKSYNYEMVAIGDSVVLLHPQGFWVSTNGSDWTAIDLPNVVGNLAFLEYVYFRGALYGLGTFSGNIERYQLTTQIARSSNLRSWEIVAEKSNLPERFFYHPVVFQDKIWIVGGQDSRHTFSDVWSSADGVNWQQVVVKAPFGARSSDRLVVFQDRLWLLGTDAWSSADGIVWQQETPQIATTDLFGYNALVYHDQLWLLGCNRAGRFRAEVLRSPDGKNWVTERAPWSPRGGVAACVFQNQILLTGGKYGGPSPENPDETEFFYSNDIWSLQPSRD